MTEVVGHFDSIGWFLIDVAWKSTALLLLVCALDQFLLKRRPIAADTIWSVTVVMLALLPLCCLALPRFAVPVSASFVRQFATPTYEPSSGEAAQLTAGPLSPRYDRVAIEPESAAIGQGLVASDETPFDTGRPAVSGPLTPNAIMIITGLYCLGVALGGFRLWTAFSSLSMLRRDARNVSFDSWTDVLREYTQRLGIRREVLLCHSSNVSVPLTVGWRHPTVILPSSILGETGQDTIKIVLLHELTHVVRADYPAHIVAKIVQCVYWYNPLMWLASRRFGEIRETVCDGYCISSLGDREGYVGVLLGFAQSFTDRRQAALGLAMIRVSRLEKRLARLMPINRFAASEKVRLAFLLTALVFTMALGITSIAKPTEDAATGTSIGDPLPQGAVARLGSVRGRHGGIVQQLQFSADGNRLASWDSTSTFRLWETTTGRLLSRHTLNQPAQLQFVSFFPGGNSLAILKGFDGKPRVWYFERDPPPQLPPPPQLGLFGGQDNETVGHFVLSSDGTVLATGTTGYQNRPRTVQFYRCISGQSLDQMKPLDVTCTVSGTIDWFSFTPDGSRLVTMTRPGGRAQNIANFRNPDERRDVTVFDVKSGVAVAQFFVPQPTQNSGRSALAISPDGQRLAVGSLKGPVHLFDLSSMKEIARFTGSQAACIDFSPDGKRLAWAGRDMAIDIWDVEKKKRLTSWKAHRSWIETIAFAPDGKTLVSGGQDHLWRLWNAATGQELLSSHGHDYWILDVALSPDGRSTVTAAADGTLRVWDTETGQQKNAMRSPTGTWVYSVAVSPDGTEVVSGETGRVAAYDLITGEQTWDYRHAEDRVFFRAINFDERNHFAAVASDGAVYVWDYRERDELPRQFFPERKNVESSTCCLSRDGKRLALSTKTRMAASSEIEIWDVDAHRLLQQLKPSLGGVEHLEFAPDGVRLLACGHSTTSGYINNQSIASPNLEDSVILWNSATGKIIRKFGLRGDLPSIRIVNTATISPNGELLITAERDGSIHIYDVGTGEQQAELRSHMGEVKSVVVSTDGKRLVSISNDLTGLVWDLKTLLKRSVETEHNE